MSGPKTERRDRETRIRDLEKAAKGELADLMPEVEALPTESIDEELLKLLDAAVENADAKVRQAKNLNGKRESTTPD